VNPQDNVRAALASLPVEAPPTQLSQRILAQGRARLVPAKVHPAWSIAIVASIVAYLGWALFYTGVL
jgi:hypothetical protein